MNLFFAILLATVSAHSQTRVELDHSAKQEFLNLHFFSNGKGMHLVPEVIDVYKLLNKNPLGRKLMAKKIEHKWGLNLVEGQVVGLFDVEYRKMNVGVLGCVACHSGKAAGVFVPGLGNKNIDVVAIGKDAKVIQNIYTKLRLSKRSGSDYNEVKASALRFAKRLSNEKIGNLTQGLVTVSFIRQWFYEQAGRKTPDDMTRGAVKIPALWGYEEKRKVGQFSDGFGNGFLPGWAVAVELTAGQTVENVREYLPRVEEAEHLFSYFLPPIYPYSIDENMSKKGELIFKQNCQGCHGSYRVDQEGWPVYEAPKWIPLQVVQTDDDRLKSNTQDFRDLVQNNPLADVLQATQLGDGYFAPRLVGIWARFPYLHNGSVPSLFSLLSPPENRPEVFNLKDAGEVHRFDELTVGLTVPQTAQESLKLLKKAKNGARNVYWTEREGQSPRGHNFGTNLNYDEKLQLIEYLKSL